ncbi:MAG: hypothetical protein FJ319_09725 [SAR202 cluster bacterium]|nr:hypothetical protein [SAR202 cluster bacterium]
MGKSTRQYLVDAKGKTKSVLLSISEYEDMVRRIEDLEDALVLDKAVRTETEFRDYSTIREELKQAGRL